MKATIQRALLVALLFAGSAAAQQQDAPLFRLDSAAFGEEALPPRLALALYEMRYEQHSRELQLLREAAFEAHVQRLAERDGRDPGAVAAELLATPPPTDAEIETLYRANRERIGAPLAEVRERIARFVTLQRRAAKREQVVAALVDEGRLTMLADAPRSPRVDIDTAPFPARGAARPAVTLVEFADYQCPFCREAGAVIERLLADHPERLRVVYVDLPVNASGISRLVAFGAACARRQDRFWDYHDLAFQRQRQLEPDSPLTLADSLELDMPAFRACLDDPATAASVERGVAEAHRLGLDSTPTIFLDGRLLILQDIETDLPRAVEAALEEAG